MPFIFQCNDVAHANTLVYDSLLKTLERFEPNGSTLYSDCFRDIDPKIEALFKANLGSDYISEYYAPSDFCPIYSFQALQHSENEFVEGDPSGFCTAWAAWYADLRLLNPNVERKTLVNLALKKLKTQPYSFTQFIRNYAEFSQKIETQIQENSEKSFEEVIKEFAEKN